MAEIQEPLFEVEPTRTELLEHYQRLQTEEFELRKRVFEMSAARLALQEQLQIPPYPGREVAFS